MSFFLVQSAFPRYVFSLCGFLIADLGFGATADEAAEKPPAGIVDWVKATAIPVATTEAGQGFSDLLPLAQKLTGVEVVALGEDTHGSREVFQMKHRLLEYLASEQGFSIFAIEANMPEARRLNDYVLGGEGEVGALIRGMYFWTWNTEEVRDMVEWMRRFNTDPKNKSSGRKIEFTGFDLQVPDVAAKIADEFILHHDSTFSSKMEEAKNALEQVTSPSRFGVATGRFPAELARGKKIVFSGWIKTENLEGYAGLWWRADTEAKTAAAFDNMAQRGPHGTTEWQRYEVALEIPAETKNINFGVLMPGKGTAWFDDLELTIDGVRYDPANAFDFGFESGTAKGFPVRSRGGYANDIVEGGHSGAKALRIRSLDDSSVMRTADVIARWTEVVQRIEAGGEGKDSAPGAAGAERAWARQNARIVVQSLEAKEDPATRDRAMAENVMWLREQNPGAKIVLWGHNGHMAKREGAMGAVLASKLGKRLAVFGFASGHGTYRSRSRDVPALGEFPLHPPVTDSVEWVCEATDLPRFILDLRSAQDAASPAWWFNLSRPHRMIGSGEIVGKKQFQKRTVGSEYDFLIWLKDVQAARGLDQSLGN